MTRIVVVAVAVLAAVAVVDAVDITNERRAAAPHDGASKAVPIAVDGPTGRFVPAGDYLRTKVMRRGREYLSAQAVDEAFPSAEEGPFDIADLAVAKDGTLALAVYRFPADRPMRAAVELWRERKLVGAFTLPPGTAGGGLAFSSDGHFLLVTSPDGRRTTVFSRSGHRMVPSQPRLLVEELSGD